MPLGAIDNTPETVNPEATAYPIWLILFLSGGWVITAIAWWFNVRSKANATTPAKSTKAQATGITTELRAACQSSDPTGASKALIIWAKSHWPDHPPLSSGEIATRVSDVDLMKALHDLDRALYAPDHSPWQGSELVKAIECFETHRTKTKSERTVISPLNPVVE